MFIEFEDHLSFGPGQVLGKQCKTQRKHLAEQHHDTWTWIIQMVGLKAAMAAEQGKAPGNNDALVKTERVVFEPEPQVKKKERIDSRL